jgi:hypothetical protein
MPASEACTLGLKMFQTPIWQNKLKTMAKAAAVPETGQAATPHPPFLTWLQQESRTHSRDREGCRIHHRHKEAGKSIGRIPWTRGFVRVAAADSRIATGRSGEPVVSSVQRWSATQDDDLTALICDYQGVA